MSKSIDNIASHENIEMDGIQKLGLLGLLGLFITLALFNVSFPTKDFG
jgi:hypothetical protein